MQGRKLERLFRPILVTLSVMLMVLPFRLRAFTFDVFGLLPGMVGVGCRYAAARSLAKKCGNNVYIGRYCTLKNWQELELGANCSIHEYCYIDALGGVIIGNNVSIAHGSSLVSFDHTYRLPEVPIREQELKTGTIEIADDVWIGAGCRILSGVKLESRTIVAAGAVVNRSFESGQIVGGVPAKVIKELGS
ncbi:MAG: acyltransferase [Planctomycetota bacterium]